MRPGPTRGEEGFFQESASRRDHRHRDRLGDDQLERRSGEAAYQRVEWQWAVLAPARRGRALHDSIEHAREQDFQIHVEIIHLH